MAINLTLSNDVYTYSVADALNLAINGRGGDNTITTTANIGNHIITTLGGNDTVTTGQGDDTVRGGNGNNTINAGDGDNIVKTGVAGGGTAGVVGDTSGAGDDTVTTLGGAEFVNAGNGDNTVSIGAGNDALIGGSGNDTLIGGSENDTLTGGSGNDTLLGGAGNDMLFYDSADGGVVGGGGRDTLRIGGATVTLDLALIGDSLLTDIEILNLTGSGDNTLTLALADVLAMSTTTDTLIVIGNPGDVINAGSGWTHGLDQVIGANTYDSYTQGTAKLLVDSDITQNITF